MMMYLFSRIKAAVGYLTGWPTTTPVAGASGSASQGGYIRQGAGSSSSAADFRPIASFTTSSHTLKGQLPEVCIARQDQNAVVATVNNWHQLIGTRVRDHGRDLTLGELRFYRRGNPGFEFANTYPCHIMVGGVDYPSTEHFFQCMALGGPYSEPGKVLASGPNLISDDPMAAKRYASARNNQKRRDWHSGVSHHIMREALAAKFNWDKHPDLAMELMSTWSQGHHILVEDSDSDQFWGAGNHSAGGKGQNKLGLMLMERRSELRKQWHGFTDEKRGRLCQASQHDSSTRQSVKQRRSERIHEGARPYQLRH